MIKIKLVFTLFIILSFGAKAESETRLKEALVEYKFINKIIGQYRFELHLVDWEINPIDESTGLPYSNRDAEMLITKLNGHPIQTIPLNLYIQNPYFEFIDLNDDKYIDLLIYTSDIPHGSISVPEAFLYIPKLKKFVKSDSISSYGAITKSKKNGCINIEYERDGSGTTIDERCFSLKTGRWKLIKTTRYKVTEY